MSTSMLPLRKDEAPTHLAIVHGQLSHGGSERQLYLFLQSCNRQRWHPHLYIAGELGIWAEAMCALNIPITLLTGSPVEKVWRFRRLCKAAGIRHFISWGSYTNAYALALTGLGISCIGSFRNAVFADLPVRGRRFWQWASLAGLTSIVCNSRATCHALQKVINHHQQVVYIPNGVEKIEERERFRTEWRRRLALDETAILVVGVGRLTSQKNFARFIDAIILANAQRPLYAVIAGPDMGERAALEQQIANAGLALNTIRLLGPIPDARALICAADIYLLASDYEGMPNVVLEAMAAGVPSVCTNVNGVAELLEQGVHGFVTERCPRALAQALLHLARDPLLRRTMGERARAQVAAEFAPATVYARLWRLCEQSVDRNCESNNRIWS